ncbi:hypothetical protein WMY93_032825, partial [Mugilogobius chulae]
MSRASANVMRRAFLFYSQRLLQNPPSVSCTAASKQHLSTPKTTFCSDFRWFSDVGTYSKEFESEKETPLAGTRTVSKPKSVFMDELAYQPLSDEDLEQHEEDDGGAAAPGAASDVGARRVGAFTAARGGRVTYLPDTHLVYSLLALVKLRVEPKSRIVQTYLRAAQERINEFDDRNLSILSACLENLEEGANVQALKQGIRLLVEQRLPRINNVIHLQTMMRLVGKDAPPTLKHKLEVTALLQQHVYQSRVSVGAVHASNAQFMISTLASVKFCSKPLLSICSRNITGKTDQTELSGIPFNRLLTVLLSFKELRFRDLQLLSQCPRYSASMVQLEQQAADPDPVRSGEPVLPSLLCWTRLQTEFSLILELWPSETCCVCSKSAPLSYYLKTKLAASRPPPVSPVHEHLSSDSSAANFLRASDACSRDCDRH